MEAASSVKRGIRMRISFWHPINLDRLDTFEKQLRDNSSDL